MAKTFKSLENLVNDEGIFSADGKGKLALNKRIYKLWFSVNGDIEAHHTCGLYLAEPTGYDKYPTLIVYVDKSTFVQEFRIQKHIYLTRLEVKGLILKDIQFVLTKEDYVSRRKKAEKIKKKELPPLPDLNEEEKELISWQTKDLPENIRETVSKAMNLSMRRQKLVDEQ